MNNSTLLVFIVSRLICASCVVSGAYLAYNGVEGWGWFLYVAFATSDFNYKIGGE